MVIPVTTTVIRAMTTVIPANTTMIQANTTVIPANTTVIMATTMVIPAVTIVIPATTMEFRGWKEATRRKERLICYTCFILALSRLSNRLLESTVLRNNI
ncbi:hypothetical protein OSB04_002077 [Centaurea solstitialis]|uniref:Uncharacterized protein n=1 Tax=Centaurea solstitialis TaxID=347529 RepID=A0AA38U2T1_9ASTR|nr:hypothetical protein OSB04_002077 [Centaurea solstitialis]